MFFLPLCLDVLTDHFDLSSSGTQEAEALTPEHFLPELLPDLRILFFDQTAAGTFIGIDKIQQELFAKTFGCVRFVYNRMLAEKKECYEKTGKNLKVAPEKVFISSLQMQLGIAQSKAVHFF